MSNLAQSQVSPLSQVVRVSPGSHLALLSILSLPRSLSLPVWYLLLSVSSDSDSALYRTPPLNQIASILIHLLIMTKGDCLFLSMILGSISLLCVHLDRFLLLAAIRAYPVSFARQGYSRRE